MHGNHRVKETNDNTNNDNHFSECSVGAVCSVCVSGARVSEEVKSQVFFIASTSHRGNRLRVLREFF
jgi:hypothetical protein